MEDTNPPTSPKLVDETSSETSPAATEVTETPYASKVTVEDCPEEDADQRQTTTDDKILQEVQDDETGETGETDVKDDKVAKVEETPFLDEDISLVGKSAAEMKALLEQIVDKVSDGQIQAQKDAHDAEILKMQELMMEANKDGLLDEDNAEDVEQVDEDGNVKQSGQDGSIMLKNTSGTHNPILDDLRKKQMRGQLSKEEEVLLGKVLDYQQRMTGAVGASDAALEEDEEVAKDANDCKIVGSGPDDGKVYLFELPFDIFSAAVRGTTMPLVPAGASDATLAGNSLVTGVRISLLNKGAGAVNDATFVLGTIRGGHPQDPDNKPQRWVDVQNPLTIGELKQNGGTIEIECNANDVVFNPAMVGITVLKGDLPRNSLCVSVLTVALDEDEEVPVGAFGPTASATNSQKDQQALLAAQQRQQQKTKGKKPPTVSAVSAASAAKKPLSALQKAVQRQTVAPDDSSASTTQHSVKQAAIKRVAPSVRRKSTLADDNDSDDDEEFDAIEAAADETHTLKPQLPPGSQNRPSAPTRKQLAADPNNPKFDPLPVKERLNRFTTDENGKPLAPDLPPGVAGYASDGTVIPIVNDGDKFNPQIPDVFGDRDHRNHVMSSTYVPEKDKPMFFNPKIKYAVVSVIGPQHCRIKTDRCVARVWGFAKNKKQCGTISKWVRQNAYMGKIWDLGVVPIDTWWPVPPIYAENATSTYSNPLHREYMEAYLNEQKRATVELEQRVLDERLNSQKKGNTISKQLNRQETERKDTAQQLRKQGKRAAPAAAPSQEQSTQTAKPRNRRAPVTQRIK